MNPKKNTAMKMNAVMTARLQDGQAESTEDDEERMRVEGTPALFLSERNNFGSY